MKLLVAATVYVVGVFVHLVSFLVLVEARQKLKLDPEIHLSYTNRIEAYGAGEMAFFGALFTSILSWLGVIFLVTPGIVWTVQDIRKSHRKISKERRIGDET